MRHKKYKADRILLIDVSVVTYMENDRHLEAGSAKANGREPKSCLGRVFNFKLGHFVLYAIAWHIKKHSLA